MDLSTFRFKYISYPVRQVKLHHKNISGKSVPWLNVSGSWLSDLGFNIGDPVRITSRDRLLIIEPLDTAERADHAYKEALQEMKKTLKKLSK
ncbi:SymE family type I addiction module toxin [Sphingobacterium spiritivorum]|uniref:SymE family type I addiction module toxin n=1 Tax=Sphingobacterium spiritivorum TaxID=258 RepID=UPI003DA255EA